eukprot:m.332776 g.332776  ORF g.332776 m.332776 type:complete len:257 (-) comp17005_c0_seq1:2087-2857(-)
MKRSYLILVFVGVFVCCAISMLVFVLYTRRVQTESAHARLKSVVSEHKRLHTFLDRVESEGHAAPMVWDYGDEGVAYDAPRGNAFSPEYSEMHPDDDDDSVHDDDEEDFMPHTLVKRYDTILPDSKKATLIRVPSIVASEASDAKTSTSTVWVGGGQEEEEDVYAQTHRHDDDKTKMRFSMGDIDHVYEAATFQPDQLGKPKPPLPPPIAKPKIPLPQPNDKLSVPQPKSKLEEVHYSSLRKQPKKDLTASNDQQS